MLLAVEVRKREGGSHIYIFEVKNKRWIEQMIPTHTWVGAAMFKSAFLVGNFPFKRRCQRACRTLL